MLSLNDHAVFRSFILESSLGGKDPSLMYRVDYRGVSNSMQPTIRKDNERVRAWKFEAVVDDAHHADLIDPCSGILSDYFHLHIF